MIMGFSWLNPNRDDEGPSSAQIIDKVEAERRAALHDAPVEGFTVDEAHREMQRHRECSAVRCARKRAARDALVRAKRMIPAGWESRVAR